MHHKLYHRATDPAQKHHHTSQQGIQTNITASTGSHPTRSSAYNRMQATADAAVQAAMSTTTQHGSPCYTVKAVVKADLLDGKPVKQPAPELWRVARVMTYDVPPSRWDTL